MEPDRRLQAVSLFGARLRGHGSDFDTPELRAWLAEQARTEAPPPAGGPAWKARVRGIDRRLPAPAGRLARRALGRLRR